jgi:hypothetical protein
MRAAFSLCALVLSAAHLPAQTITVLHSFTTRGDGSQPFAEGGEYTWGTVWEITP